MKISHALFCLALVGAAMSPSSVGANPATSRPDTQQIVAVINTDAITSYDVEVRTRLALLSAQVARSKEAEAYFSKQALTSLIDEAVQLQEAKRLDIMVTAEEVAAAIAQLEQQSRMPEGGLPALLKQNNIPLSTMERQLKASIAWAKTVRRRHAIRAQVSEAEVDRVLNQLQANAGQPEYRLFEIGITEKETGNNASGDAQQLARRLMQELEKGANFMALARQFSDSATAAVGGDLGWLMAQDLPKPLDSLIERLQPGQVSAPVRTDNGFRIIYMDDRRLIGYQGNDSPRLGLHQLVLANADKGAEVAAQITSCAVAEKLAADVGTSASGSLGTVNLRDLPASMQNALQPLETGQASKPIELNGQWSIFTICERTRPQLQLPSRAAIQERLQLQKLDNLATRYLRDLRRAAYIDIKI